jgi:hypothetical protein
VRKETPMNFEVQNALTTLDKRTPAFLISEAFAHGDMTAKKRAIEALKDLESVATSKQLRSRLSLY